MPPPRAARSGYAFHLHGELRHDEYAHLRDPGDSRTRDYIAREQRYLAACLEPVSEWRERLFRELSARIVETDQSVAETVMGYRYYTRIEAGYQYPVHCRHPVDGQAPERVYLDENRIAGDGQYCDVSVVSICPRHQRVACTVDRVGGETYEILVADMDHGDFTRRVERAGDGIAWSRDGCLLFYTGVDHNARPCSVWLHDLNAGTHHRLYAEADPAFHVTVWPSRSGEWIFIDCAGNSSSETRVIRADQPFSKPRVLIPRREEIEYTADHHGERFLVLTNEGAENFRLLSLPIAGSGPATELIPAREQITLEYLDVYRRYWIVGELHAGTRRVAVLDTAGGSRHELPGCGPLACIDVEDLYDYDAPFVRYEYSTPVIPPAVHDFDPVTGVSTLRKSMCPPGYRESDYRCERLEVPVDGVRVPLTLVWRCDLDWPENGAPLLLTGYGAYEESLEPDFDSDLPSLLDRGVVAVTAHVRGGGDLGPAWHDAGRLSEKDNSFRDFLACAHWLVAQGYTSRGRIAARGASAGGLLVAVAAARDPGLFASIVLEVPFLDVVNTLLDTSLPLTEYDFDEFGNPALVDEYQWLRAYSPYDNIRAQCYPPMLVTTAMNDQRVGYWEALKWTARLRAAKTDDNPLLLKVDKSGHLGETGRYDAVRETALVYTFLLDMWGLTTDK